MDITNLAIGISVGFLFGVVVLWIMDRRHQAEIRKLMESRRKIERQRTQAVNDLFALRAELDNPARVETTTVVETVADPRSEAELANLRSLIARADGALTAARRKRDENEAEIARLRSMLDESQRANVIDLRKQDRLAL